MFNTLFNLLTQDDQVRCFENVAAHLTDDGVFVVEAFVPDATSTACATTSTSTPRRSSVDEVRLDVGRHDPVAQLLDESHVSLVARGRAGCSRSCCRYAWPSELDLMARIAGLRLDERWGGWKGEEFTSTSKRHVSVYGR